MIVLYCCLCSCEVERGPPVRMIKGSVGEVVGSLSNGAEEVRGDKRHQPNGRSGHRLREVVRLLLVGGVTHQTLCLAQGMDRLLAFRAPALIEPHYQRGDADVGQICGSDVTCL